MPTWSVWVDAEDAAQAQLWADRLGVDRSDFLLDALHRHLVCLASETDTQPRNEPLDEGRWSLAPIADWGPTEEWSDWADAAG